ncbi:hypothetical protein O4J56_01010 [Nocardiopsis sp. RSe5-2]|uniref:DUF2867 domain-containing protein n=1 Tax=Nocardiopsis endophytica TaxID=3018445 RepID=A0ABT4TYJ4_9ACTN|nr:hypothetical protein [Nocardiopsis endophytica]MDA2809202.1 hypothetical protein [Nocardiopsis endophytica]
MTATITPTAPEPAVTERRTPPPETAALTSFGHYDYADLFTLTMDRPAPWTSEEWLRAMCEEVLGRPAQVLWRGVLGLRLRPGPSTDRIAGWRISGSGEGWTRLEAPGWMMSVQLVMAVDGSEATFATFVQYRNGAGRALWSRLSAVHRGEAPGLLRSGYEALSA